MVPWMSRHIQLLSLVIDNEGLHSCPRSRHAQLKHSYAQLSHFRRVELAEGLLSDAYQYILVRFHAWWAALTFI